MSTEKEKGNKSFKSWLDGDMLLSPLLQRHLGLFLLMFVLVIAYVSNRYAFQREQVQIQRLRSELNDVKYEALARSSELMEKSRESNIQRYVVEQGSELKIPTKAPVVIKR
jgi:ABC-type transport system involved in cytochrome bd biosynthesis fused ATPase/permease subunit